MKLLVVTGFAGFIGSHVTRALLNHDHFVYGVDNFTNASNKKDLIRDILEHKNFFLKEADICELESIPDCDYVVNLAAETHVGNSIIDDNLFVHSNVSGVQNILQLLRKKPCNVSDRPTLLHFSTDEVYGDTVSGSFTEESLLNPSNPYAASKAAADLLIKSYHRTHGIDYVILRPTNNYGTHQYPEKLIPISVKALLRSRKIKLHDKGEPIRNWLHAEDTASAVLTVIDSGVRNNIYNISGNCEQKNIVTVKKVINAFFEKNCSGFEEFLDLNHTRDGQDVRYSVDDTKLRNLGWQPKKNFDQEIENIVKFYKSNFVW